jgi:hypothetical protein
MRNRDPRGSLRLLAALGAFTVLTACSQSAEPRYSTQLMIIEPVEPSAPVTATEHPEVSDQVSPDQR